MSEERLDALILLQAHQDLLDLHNEVL